MRGEPAAFGFLERHGDRVGLALVAQITQSAQVIGSVGESGQDLGVDAYRGGVVLPARPNVGSPDRPAVGDGDHLDVAAVVIVLARPPQIHSRGGSGVRQRSVSTSIPSMFTWL